MRCPICHVKMKVIDSRDHGKYKHRRRECPECLTRFNTKETINFNSMDEYVRRKILFGEEVVE